MLRRFCDVCDKEIAWADNRDSKTQYFTLTRDFGGDKQESDICNECMHKLIKYCGYER